MVGLLSSSVQSVFKFIAIIMGCCFASDKDTSSSSKNPKRIQVNPGVPNVDIKKKDLQPTQVNIKSPKPNPDVFEESKANQYDNIRPEERKKLSIDCKIKGNEFFKAKKFVLAINEYTQAIVY